MKKIITIALAALMLVCLFAGCKKKNASATPGSMVVPTHTPSVGQEQTPAGEEERSAICNATWLDTDSFDEYTLFDDGTLTVERERTNETESGEWALSVDQEGKLVLSLSFEKSESLTLYELELYDTSIFAVDESGTAYIWLLQDE